FRSGSTTYEECLEVRDALEPLIDNHAARYHRVSDIRELNRIVKSMEAVKDDPAAFFKCNWALHRRIAQLCRNSPLRSMYLALIDFLEYSVDHAEFARFDGEGMVAVHRDLVQAIDVGEGPELEAAIEAHAPTAGRDRLTIRGRRETYRGLDSPANGGATGALRLRDLQFARGRAGHLSTAAVAVRLGG